VLRWGITSIAGVLLLASLAHAAPPKPIISTKTKAVEVSVAFDDAIKARPELSANILGEGKRWAERERREADREWQNSPELFRGGQRWTLERDYAVVSVVANRYVSILRTDYTYTGGAHPNTTLETVLWDEQTKKRISIRPFFNDLSDNSRAMIEIQNAVISALTVEKKERGTYDPNDNEWFKSLQPSLFKIGAVVLEPSSELGKSSGLTFHYSPYAVGPYAEGAYTAFVSWRILRPYLTAEGLAIFGGDKPKDPKTQ
jgi:Deacetylase PdaC